MDSRSRGETDARAAFAYFRTGILETSIANHFVCSFPIVASVVSGLIAAETTGVSFEPFDSTAPYLSFVMIWPPIGPYFDGFVFRCEATIGTSIANASQTP